MREYLKSVADSDLPARERAARSLRASFQHLSRDMGKKENKVLSKQQAAFSLDHPNTAAPEPDAEPIVV